MPVALGTKKAVLMIEQGADVTCFPVEDGVENFGAPFFLIQCEQGGAYRALTALGVFRSWFWASLSLGGA